MKALRISTLAVLAGIAVSAASVPTGARAGVLKDAATAAATGAAQGLTQSTSTIVATAVRVTLTPAPDAPSAVQVAAPAIPPATVCRLAGDEAAFVARWRDKGMTETDQNTGIAAKPIHTQADEDFQVRMTRTIYTVYHDDRYQRGVSPVVIGAMVRDDCLERLQVYARVQ